MLVGVEVAVGVQRCCEEEGKGVLVGTEMC